MALDFYGAAMSLDEIRSLMKMLEDDIISSLFKRSCYKKNNIIYDSASTISAEVSGSYFEYIFRNIQKAHALAGRFEIDAEIPFFGNLPQPQIHRVQNELPLGPTEINLNPRILQMYMQAIEHICEEGDDGEYGDSASTDVRILDAISTRVHRCGLNVADIKYSREKEMFDTLVNEQSREEIMNKITDSEQEESVLRRVGERGEFYGLNPRYIESFYREKAIPLTKEAEVLRIFEVSRRRQAS